LQIPIDEKVKKMQDIPYTISYIIRKNQMIDSMNEIPKDKRPPEKMLWDGDPEEVDDWIDKIYDPKRSNTIQLEIPDSEIG
jgi:hypothetical protein